MASMERVPSAAEAVDQVLPFQIVALPAVSTAMQNDEEAQLTASSVSDPSTSEGLVQVVPLYVMALPASSTAAQKDGETRLNGLDLVAGVDVRGAGPGRGVSRGRAGGRDRDPRRFRCRWSSWHRR